MNKQDLQIGEAYICKRIGYLILVKDKLKSIDGTRTIVDMLVCSSHPQKIDNCLWKGRELLWYINDDDFAPFPRKRFEQIAKMINQLSSAINAIITLQNNGNY